MKKLLEIHDLTASYGKVPAVTNVRLSLREGEIVSVIGPNGAGKSTFLNAVMGILPSYGSSTGHIALGDEDISSLPVEARVQRGLSLVPEKRELFATMNVADNLMLGAQGRRKDAGRQWMDQLPHVLSLFPRLEERKNQLAGTLSGGERQMLALGRALMGKPRVLMLDEPSLGLAPLVVQEVFKIITALRSTNVSILLIEQNARAALQISDYAYVLEDGKISFEGKASDLSSDPRIVQAYLGSGTPSSRSQFEVLC